MWGGTPQRNMINTVEKNIPDTWDVATGKNIKWVAQLGSQSFGNPVVAGGKIFVGTNNQFERQPKVKGDKGVVMCFREADGKFLWQNVHDKLAAGRVNDWPKQGICSTCNVDGNRVYYVSNRCELVCADVDGANDGSGQRQDPLEARHDQGTGRLPPQHVGQLAEHRRRPGLRRHQQRRR